MVLMSLGIMKLVQGLGTLQTGISCCWNEMSLQVQDTVLSEISQSQKENQLHDSTYTTDLT